MTHQAGFHRCLVECDVAGIRRLWAYCSPDAPQPKSDHDTLAAIHYARTLMQTISLSQRAWSHCWLLDHGLPSGLPDELKPKAERLYPRIAEGVGIAVKGGSAIGRAVAPIIQSAMADAVLEAYADKRTDPAFVKARMLDARTYTIGKLLGRRTA